LPAASNEAHQFGSIGGPDSAALDAPRAAPVGRGGAVDAIVEFDPRLGECHRPPRSAGPAATGVRLGFAGGVPGLRPRTRRRAGPAGRV